MFDKPPPARLYAPLFTAGNVDELSEFAPVHWYATNGPTGATTGRKGQRAHD